MFPAQYTLALPSLPRSQSAEIKRENGEENLTSPCALWHPLPSCLPYPCGCIPTSHHLQGWEAAELGHRTGKSDSRRFGPAVTTWDTCQRHSSLTSAFTCRTDCLWVSSRLLIWLADSRRVMATTAEGKEKGLAPHTQDFCRGSLTRIQPLTLHLPQSLLDFHPFLPSPPPHPCQLQVNSPQKLLQFP